MSDKAWTIGDIPDWAGGVLTAWLAAYARPGQIRAMILEDPPLFTSEAARSSDRARGRR